MNGQDIGGGWQRVSSKTRLVIPFTVAALGKEVRGNGNAAVEWAAVGGTSVALALLLGAGGLNPTGQPGGDFAVGNVVYRGASLVPEASTVAEFDGSEDGEGGNLGDSGIGGGNVAEPVEDVAGCGINNGNDSIVGGCFVTWQVQVGQRRQF